MKQDGKTRGHSRPRIATLVVLLAALLTAVGLAITGPVAPPADAAQDRASTPECAAGVDFLGFSDALNKRTYEGTSVGGLSALTYDGRRGVYYSLVDNGPAATSEARFYTLRIPTKGGVLGTPEILGVTTLRDASGQPFTASNFDGEGLTLTRRGDLLASSETEPSIRRFDLDGNLLEELPVPQKFRVAPAGQAQRNQTFESLALAPNGRSLFTAVEGPLAPDGRTAEGENRIRILRYEDRGPGGFQPVDEFFYLTEPGQGVVEIVALSEDELLVLERGFQSGVGNTVRVFRVSLDGAEDVSGEPSLAAPGLEPVEKELLVDVADCPSGGATTPGTQPNPLLDNYESLTLGPRLPGGRRSLLLQSDDNFSAGQVTRVVALGVENRQLWTGR
ncbi:MAG: esterase-like activity of phytase family protein [Actinomycetota bacterium]|nr:esterase-like activity of phytase family protein [Actinomycetota bacterium]